MAHLLIQAGLERLKQNPELIPEIGGAIWRNKDKIKEYLPKSLGQSEFEDEHQHKKRKIEDKPIQSNEVDSSSDVGGSMEVQQSQISAPQTAGVRTNGNGGSSGIGYRGNFRGNTELHKGYASHYHEIHELHSRKVKNSTFYWGFQTTDVNSRSPLNATIPKQSGIAVMNNAGIQTGVMAPWLGTADNSAGYQDASNFIYANAINFTVNDCIDNKLISGVTGSPGLMINYLKFKLKHFEVEITPRTYRGSVPQVFPGWALAKAGANTPKLFEIDKDNPSNYGHARNDAEIDMDYWVYRDVYNDFTTNANPTFIPIAPPESTSTTTADTYNRTVRSIRNLDTYLTVMNNKTPFTFQREINQFGNYYFSYSDLVTLQQQSTNIQTLINTLEGITGQPGGPNNLPESFNLIFGPTQADYYIDQQIKGNFYPGGGASYTFGTVWANLHTELYIKITCTWEGFDFNYGTLNGPTRALTSPHIQTLIETYEEQVRRQKENRNSL